MLTRTFARISGLLIAVAFLVTSMSTASISAAPGSQPANTVQAAQNVDWMSAEQASQLALDFPVMVPTWIPAPFGGSPSIQAGGGYYSLYWMISGGDATFLQITGEVGGSLPAGSPADLNQQLFINASVQGYEAIHDVTSIYDNVWWIAGGVLYTVSSNNMTGTDSLSLANSLVALQAPAPPEPEPTPTPVPAEPTPAPTPTPVPAEPTSAPEPPSVVEEPEPTNPEDPVGGVQEPDEIDTDTSVEETTTGQTQTDASEVDPTATVVPDDVEEEATGNGVASDGTSGSLPPDLEQLVEQQAIQTPESGGTNGATISDGTAGAQIPTRGDGTGGVRQIVVP